MVSGTEPSAPKSVSRNFKRLVILCDGSWQSADRFSFFNPSRPTNIVRLTRAIKPTTWTYKMNDEGEMVRTQVDQVTYYQSGVGTGFGDTLAGGALGIGVSEKIRGAYGFLANNYCEGDTIAIFGFSRGAYTARAIGGLITRMGLLTKRGMDNFHDVYSKYYNDKPIMETEEEKYGLFRLAPGTIEVIGAFDTVGFHTPFNYILPKKLRQTSFISRFVGEQYEMTNTELPDGVKYAFHALSLDEMRWAFKPTLWFQRKDRVRPRIEQSNGEWDGNTVLEQVWFSGTHSHVGGGLDDQDLSTIPFGWMTSQLVKYNLLDLDPNYLLRDGSQGDSREKWATKDREASGFLGLKTSFTLINKVEEAIFNIITWLFALFFINRITARLPAIGGVRTPGRYKVNPVNHNHGTHLFVTNEYFHSSISDRNLKKSAAASSWPCVSLQKWQRGNDQKPWVSPYHFLSKPIKMRQAKLGDVEKRCKNNLRDIYREALIARGSSKRRPSVFTEGVEHNDNAENTVSNGF